MEDIMFVKPYTAGGYLIFYPSNMISSIKIWRISNMMLKQQSTTPYFDIF